MTLDEVIKQHVLQTLSESPSKAEAARKLGVTDRTIRNYLHRWNMLHLIGTTGEESRIIRLEKELGKLCQ